MPKSKRNKVVSLTKVQKKGRERKEQLIKSARECLEEFQSCYVFQFENMRNAKLKEFREEVKDTSRLFLGSNKVLQVALGRDESSAHRDNSHKVSELLQGDRGLFFSNLAQEEVERLFGEVKDSDYARTGAVATETVELSTGPLEMFTHDMEPMLRKQGMPVRLNRGVVELVADFTVCREGEPVTPEGARLLRLLQKKLAIFKLHLLAKWTPRTFEILSALALEAPTKKAGRPVVDGIMGVLEEGSGPEDEEDED